MNARALLTDAGLVAAAVEPQNALESAFTTLLRKLPAGPEDAGVLHSKAKSDRRLWRKINGMDVAVFRVENAMLGHSSITVLAQYDSQFVHACNWHYLDPLTSVVNFPRVSGELWFIVSSLTNIRITLKIEHAKSAQDLLNQMLHAVTDAVKKNIRPTIQAAAEPGSAGLNFSWLFKLAAHYANSQVRVEHGKSRLPIPLEKASAHIDIPVGGNVGLVWTLDNDGRMYCLHQVTPIPNSDNYELSCQLISPIRSIPVVKRTVHRAVVPAVSVDMVKTFDAAVSGVRETLTDAAFEAVEIIKTLVRKYQGSMTRLEFSGRCQPGDVDVDFTFKDNK